jgi:hypothetical protein
VVSHPPLLIDLLRSVKGPNVRKVMEDLHCQVYELLGLLLDLLFLLGCQGGAAFIGV